MNKLTWKIISIIALGLLSLLAKPSDTFAEQYRYFQYFEGLPSDYSEEGWQGYNYYESDAFDSGKPVSLHAPDKKIDGEFYTCVGWKDGSGSIPAGGELNHLAFDLNDNSSITWIYEVAHRLTVKAEPALQDLWAWGYNVYGQLGVGDNADRNSPTLQHRIRRG